MLSWAVARAVYLNQNLACRFITLDAKRHDDNMKDSYHFYKKYNFKVLKKNDKCTDTQIAKQKTGTTPMYIDLYHIIKAFKDKEFTERNKIKK